MFCLHFITLNLIWRKILFFLSSSGFIKHEKGSLLLAFETSSLNSCCLCWLGPLCLFTDGWWGLAVATETSGSPGASAGAEERHHQSGLRQRVRRGWAAGDPMPGTLSPSITEVSVMDSVKSVSLGRCHRPRCPAMSHRGSVMSKISATCKQTSKQKRCDAESVVLPYRCEAVQLLLWENTFYFRRDSPRGINNRFTACYSHDPASMWMIHNFGVQHLSYVLGYLENVKQHICMAVNCGLSYYWCFGEVCRVIRSLQSALWDTLRTE